MWQLHAHGLTFTLFKDPFGERWVEILRERDRRLICHEPLVDDDLEDFVERWIRHQLGADHPGIRRCERCDFEVWSDDYCRGRRPGDQAVDIEATIEIGGVIHFAATVLCRDCAEHTLEQHSWLPTLTNDEP